MEVRKKGSNIFKVLKIRTINCLAGVAQLVGALFQRPKDQGFDYQSGHIPRLHVQSPVGHIREEIQSINQSIMQEKYPSGMKKNKENLSPGGLL